METYVTKFSRPSASAPTIAGRWPLAAVFDCDGLLLDTHACWHRAYEAVALEAGASLEGVDLDLLNCASVAYAAQRFHIPAFIFLPRNANPVKRARIADLGAKIFESGQDITDAYRAANSFAHGEGLYFLNDATDPDLPAGPATIACEILEVLSETGTIYVPMGDTAMIRGVAAAAKQISPKVRIVGVQAERAPSYYLSWREGSAVATETCDTIADGLATRTPDETNVQAIRDLVDDVRLITEAEGPVMHRHEPACPKVQECLCRVFGAGVYITEGIGMIGADR